MLIFRNRYSFTCFNICLKSINSNVFITSYFYPLHRPDTMYKKIRCINTILRIENMKLKQKIRFNFLLNNYSLYHTNKYSLLIYKYKAKFQYLYKTYYKSKLSFKGTTQKRYQTFIAIKARTYLYTVYRLLNSKYPLFIFYYLFNSKNKSYI